MGLAGDPNWRVQNAGDFVHEPRRAGLLGTALSESGGQFRPLRERNFAACCIIIFCAFAVLYAASTSLPVLLPSLFGYDAPSAGSVMPARLAEEVPPDPLP
jgi:MFS transporter, DHA2 family, multidrug resistance protein